MNRISSPLHKLIRRHGWKLEDLAKAIGTSRDKLSEKINHEEKFRVEMLKKIAEALKVTPLTIYKRLQ